MSLLVHWFKALQMSNMGAEGCAKLWAAEHQKQPPKMKNLGKLKEKKKCHIEVGLKYAII